MVRKLARLSRRKIVAPGRIQLPDSALDNLNWSNGDQISIYLDLENGQLILKREED